MSVVNLHGTHITRRQLAIHLCVSTKTVDRLVAKGCPSIKVGRARRFDLEAVQAWLADREEAA